MGCPLCSPSQLIALHYDVVVGVVVIGSHYLIVIVQAMLTMVRRCGFLPKFAP